MKTNYGSTGVLIDTSSAYHRIINNSEIKTCFYPMHFSF